MCIRISAAAFVLLVVLANQGGCTTLDDWQGDNTEPRTPSPTPEITPDPTPPEPEDCDGVDNNGDGLVDEGFPDADADGVADCVDLWCGVSDGPVEVIPDLGCDHLAPDISETYDVVVQAFLQEPDLVPGCGTLMSEVFVLQANDDDGDGGSTGSDELDVALLDGCQGVPGQTHGVLFEASSGESVSVDVGTVFFGPVPDADGDGAADFGGIRISYSPPTLHFRVSSASGSLVWQTNSAYDVQYDVYGSWIPAPLDVTGDGVPEVLWCRRVFDLQTGEILHVADSAPVGGTTVQAAVTDLDLDGQSEVLMGQGAFDGTGALLWSVPDPTVWTHALPVQIDADAYAEVVVVAGSGVWILNDQGAVEFATELLDRHAAPPCLADIDGDGSPEIVGMVESTFSDTFLRAMELDGSELWRREVYDPTGWASCAAFDFEGDGRFEILYQDQQEMTIRDGLTGEVLYRFDDLLSGTAFEYPVAVDVDKDGSSEIVFAVPWTSAGPGGVAILSSPRGLWMAGADAWPTWDYRVDNVNVDGSVPLHPPATWLSHNSVRAAPQNTRPHPNLRPVIAGSCHSGCLDESQMRLVFTVVNDGLVEAPAGYAVVLRDVAHPDGPDLWADVLTDPIAPGATGPTWEYVTTRAEVGAVLEIVVDPSFGFGVVPECVEVDNRVEWVDPCGG